MERARPAARRRDAARCMTDPAGNLAGAGNTSRRATRSTACRPSGVAGECVLIDRLWLARGCSGARNSSAMFRASPAARSASSGMRNRDVHQLALGRLRGNRAGHRISSTGGRRHQACGGLVTPVRWPAGDAGRRVAALVAWRPSGAPARAIKPVAWRGPHARRPTLSSPTAHRTHGIAREPAADRRRRVDPVRYRQPLKASR